MSPALAAARAVTRSDVHWFARLRLAHAASPPEGSTSGSACAVNDGWSAHGSFSTTRSRALDARGFSAISASDGLWAPRHTSRTCGVAPHTHGSPGGHVHPPVAAL